MYEGLTKSDLALGRYLKSFNKGVKVPPLPQGIKPNERVAYMMLARHPQEVAKLLDIGATYGIPEDGEEEFDDIAAEIDIQETLKKIAELTSDRSRGAVRGATADVVYVYEHLDRKDELKKAADLYRNGQSDAGYTALKNALGDIDFEYFVSPIVKLWKSENTYSDDKLFVLNPDIKSHLLRNHWLIHETSVEAGLSILKNGFDRGNLAGDLGMTTWGKHSQTGDYLFAHDVVDMLSHENYKSRGFGSYGNFALVFQGSGYKAYHDIDEENQVMFDYHEPKAFFVILYRDEAEEAGFPVKNTEYEDYKYAVYGQGKSGAPSILFANENVYKCLEWILQHGASYRNVMFKVGAPAVTESVQSLYENTHTDRAVRVNKRLTAFLSDFRAEVEKFIRSRLDEEIQRLIERRVLNNRNLTDKERDQQINEIRKYEVVALSTITLTCAGMKCTLLFDAQDGRYSACCTRDKEIYINVYKCIDDAEPEYANYDYDTLFSDQQYEETENDRIYANMCDNLLEPCKKWNKLLVTSQNVDDIIKALIDMSRSASLVDTLRHELTHADQRNHPEQNSYSNDEFDYGRYMAKHMPSVDRSSDSYITKYHSIFPWEIDAKIQERVTDIVKKNSNASITDIAKEIYDWAVYKIKDLGLDTPERRKQCWQTAVALTRAALYATKEHGTVPQEWTGHSEEEQQAMSKLIDHMGDYPV